MHVAVTQKYFITIIVLCIGKLILSLTPSFVCVGDSTNLTCNSSTGRLEWIVMFPESVEPIPVSRQFTTTRVTEEIFQVTANQTVTVFHIQRRSDYNTTPLVTSLLIDNVSAGINKTNISCKALNSDSENKQFVILAIDNHRHGKLKS